MPFSGSTDERTKGEQGFVLAMTALMIVPLIIFTAFAVDLGAWYGQAAKMQRAADAASLAGVVQLPDKVKAVAAAEDTLAKNGFAYTCVTAPATGPCVVSYPSGAGQQMNVALQTSASQYFSKIVLKSETLNRDATAVYNLKIPLGSPSNVFGNDPTRSGTQPNLWAAINGPYSNHAD
ncbi:MAG: pilus assembly protein TadG-related protein, partial [Acidimicrobiales bacterium]